MVSGLDFGSAEATHVDLIKFNSRMTENEASEIVGKESSVRAHRCMNHGDDHSIWSLDATGGDDMTDAGSDYSTERMHRELYPVQSPFSEYSVKAHPLAKGGSARST